MLLAATSLLLLIARTNVANLLLARAVVSERDLAIRASLGAGRSRLFGQAIGETIALGVLGSSVGIGLAWGMLRVFVTLAPANFPRLAAIALDTGVLGFSLIVAVAAGLLAGLAPAIHLLRADLNSLIRSGSSRSVTTRCQGCGRSKKSWPRRRAGRACCHGSVCSSGSSRRCSPFSESTV